MYIVHLFVHSTSSLYNCVTCHLLCGKGPWSVFSLCIHIHTQKTHTAVIMCVFLCLFNLDGMFHLQAAITAGCLIVRVRLMGMCASLSECVCCLQFVHILRIYLQMFVYHSLNKHILSYSIYCISSLFANITVQIVCVFCVCMLSIKPHT